MLLCYFYYFSLDFYLFYLVKSFSCTIIYQLLFSILLDELLLYCELLLLLGVILSFLFSTNIGTYLFQQFFI